ncbi:MAG: hypothetical protein ACRDIE_19350, partial [Chloroflexota bacterium]
MVEGAVGGPTPIEAAQARIKRRALISRTIALVIVSAGALFILTPVFWMLSTSLKTLAQTLTFPPVWIPFPFQFKNYPDALST